MVRTEGGAADLWPELGRGYEAAQIYPLSERSFRSDDHNHQTCPSHILAARAPLSASSGGGPRASISGQ
jgi:hypothetical protein